MSELPIITPSEATPQVEEADEQKPKLQVLCLFDSPTCATGFAQVSRNILKVLQATDKYEFTIIGINHSDYYDREKYPYRIYEASPALTMDPRYRDLFGRQRFLDFLGSGKFDLVFTLQDTFIIEDIAPFIVETRKKQAEANKGLGYNKYKPFKWLFYYPIDASPKANWILQSANLADYPVCYTEWGKHESVEAARQDIPQVDHIVEIPKMLNRIDVVYHGTNLSEFYPTDAELTKKFRHEFFQGKADGKLLIVNVNRNQPRKDLAKTMAAFDKFLMKHPDSFLYMHCQANDAGGNLFEVARNFKNLKLDENWGVPANFEANKGYPIEMVNQIYNAADAVVSTTWGEGWGLSFTEAMATKTLVIAPNNTSVPEIIGKDEERGLLIACGDNASAFIIGATGDNERIRPLVNVDDLVRNYERAYDHMKNGTLQDKVDAAYEWVKQLSWDGPNIGGKWLSIFQKAEDQLKLDNSILAQKVGRNDQCPCGSGKKYKHCHGSTT